MASKGHCAVCFEALVARLEDRPAAAYAILRTAQWSDDDVSQVNGTKKEAIDIQAESYPLFVTWNTIDELTGDKALRGCIGTFEAQELSVGLPNYALTAAFADDRFDPIDSSELPTLSCDVTLLADFTPCQDPLDWNIGDHGLRISFTHHSSRYSGTFLPNVAVDQGWNKDETLQHLVKKAGWRGSCRSLDSANSDGLGIGLKNVKIVRYSGSKATLRYEDWANKRSRIS